ncbi:PhzF family phenazine biosynthesis protein [Nocardia sp. CDC159]|uniref:PhzF family phenazine biosynthesis protein n=1 Tax=Nocardia pulmonis TaxID=2951408 RepID=A0A9X2E449_9NOCA|nr:MULTISPECIES: PhzF family phenazine biosynthesis protein [Nocardia]MCM6773300.1 PhzF family phenazine biosynthesis protein [Nocardia pulmonis]MCM6786187.1 PhzF family phenazine biosynthesis protein [Nocardia sp. CDC159]
MEVLLHQIDAFADAPFTGNPAAVMPLLDWLPDGLLQQLAEENNLAETAFYTSALPPSAGVAPADGLAFHLRWFTPEAEIDMCGHATMATAAQILEDLQPGADRVHFFTRSGWLTVDRTDDDEYVLDLPAMPSVDVVPDPDLAAAVGVRAIRALTGQDEVLVVATEAEVRAARPNVAAFPKLSRGVIITAPGDTADFVSRYFAPGAVPEDPVTGSAHAQLVPLWARDFGRLDLTARQLSARGGRLRCTLAADRVLLAGRCHRYLDGVVRLSD